MLYERCCMHCSIFFKWNKIVRVRVHSSPKQKCVTRPQNINSANKGKIFTVICIFLHVIIIIKWYFLCEYLWVFYLIFLLYDSLRPSDAYMRHWTRSSLVSIMVCRLVSAKPLSKPTLTYSQLDPEEQTSIKFETMFARFHWRKCNWKCRLR